MADLRSLRLKKFAIGERLIAYGLDGSIVPRALCGMCGNNYDLKGKDQREIAVTLGSHLRHYHNDIFQGAFPSLPDLRSSCMAAEFLPNGVDSVTNTERNLILLRTDPLFAEVVSLLEANKFVRKQERIIIASWLTPAKCSNVNRNAIILDGWHRSCQGWIGTATPEQWHILTNNDAAEVQVTWKAQLHELAAAQRILKEGGLARCSQSSGSSSDRVDATVGSNHKEEEPIIGSNARSSSETCKPASAGRSGRIFCEAVAVARAAIEDADEDTLFGVNAESSAAFVHVGTNLVMRLDKNGTPKGLMCPGKRNTVEGGLYIRDFQVRVDAYGDIGEARRRSTRPTTTTPAQTKQKNKLLRIVFADVATDETMTITDDVKQRSAYLTRDIERHGPDMILVEACSAFFETGCRLLGEWSLIEKVQLNAMFAGLAGNPVYGSRVDGYNDLLLDEFNTNLQAMTVRDYAKRLAKFFRIYMEEGIGNYHMITAALHQVIVLQPSQAFSGGGLSKSKEFKHLVALISKTLYLIACNPDLIVNQVLQHFLFEEVNGFHNHQSDEENGSDRGEEEDEPCSKRVRTTDAESNGPKKIQIRNVSTIRKSCQAYLCALRMAVGLEIEHFLMQLRKPLAETVTIVETDRPFEKVKAEFRQFDAINYRYLASVSTALNALNKDS